MMDEGHKKKEIYGKLGKHVVHVIDMSVRIRSEIPSQNHVCLQKM